MFLRIKLFLLILLALAISSCQQSFQFDYKTIDGDTAINTLPYGKNYDLMLYGKNPLIYSIVHDSIITSVYFVTHLGCPSVQVEPIVNSKQDSLILSFKLNKLPFLSGCEVTKVQFNYRIKNQNYKGVFFEFPDMKHHY